MKPHRDSSLKTIDNKTANLTVWTAKLSSCGEANGFGNFDYFYAEERATPGTPNWFVNQTKVEYDMIGISASHVVAESDFVGIFPIPNGEFDTDWKGHAYQQMTLHLSDHSTALTGEIDTFGIFNPTWHTWNTTTFYTEPNSWPNNQTGPNASWYILM
jgi:hypothetical protein